MAISPLFGRWHELARRLFHCLDTSEKTSEPKERRSALWWLKCTKWPGHGNELNAELPRNSDSHKLAAELERWNPVCVGGEGEGEGGGGIASCVFVHFLFHCVLTGVKPRLSRSSFRVSHVSYSDEACLTYEDGIMLYEALQFLTSASSFNSKKFCGSSPRVSSCWNLNA